MSISVTPSFFFSSRRRHTRFDCDWSSDVCSSDLVAHSGNVFNSTGYQLPGWPTGSQRASCGTVLAVTHHLSLKPDRKSTRLNSSHSQISYAVFCLKKKKKKLQIQR